MMLMAILFAGVVFYEMFVGLKTLGHVRAMLETSRSSLAVTQSAAMSDEEKAVAMQRASLKMFGALFWMLGKLAVAVAATAAALYAISLVRWSVGDLVGYSVQPLPLAVMLLFLTAYGYIRHGRRAGT